MWEKVWIFMHPVIHVLGFLTLIVLTVLAIGMVIYYIIKTFWKVFVAIGIIFFLVIIIFFFLGTQISI